MGAIIKVVDKTGTTANAGTVTEGAALAHNCTDVRNQLVLSFTSNITIKYSLNGSTWITSPNFTTAYTFTDVNDKFWIDADWGDYVSFTATYTSYCDTTLPCGFDSVRQYQISTPKATGTLVPSVTNNYSAALTVQPNGVFGAPTSFIIKSLANVLYVSYYSRIFRNSILFSSTIIELPLPIQPLWSGTLCNVGAGSLTYFEISPTIKTLPVVTPGIDVSTNNTNLFQNLKDALYAGNSANPGEFSINEFDDFLAGLTFTRTANGVSFTYKPSFKNSNNSGTGPNCTTGQPTSTSKTTIGGSQVSFPISLNLPNPNFVDIAGQTTNISDCTTQVGTKIPSFSIRFTGNTSSQVVYGSNSFFVTFMQNLSNIQNLSYLNDSPWINQFPNYSACTTPRQVYFTGSGSNLSYNLLITNQAGTTTYYNGTSPSPNIPCPANSNFLSTTTVQLGGGQPPCTRVLAHNFP